jgi:hypothetical protein
LLHRIQREQKKWNKHRVEIPRKRKKDVGFD